MEIVMKKTAFDKIVVGFVILVVLIFSLLMIYSISTTQNTVLAERKSTMQKEIELLMDGPLTDYSNNTIDNKTLFTELQNTANTLEMGIWLTDERSNIIFRSSASSDSNDSGKNQQTDTTQNLGTLKNMSMSQN